MVYLRQRPRKDGCVSLFLRSNFDGVRKDEYLRLYLVPEVTRADRDKNRDTLALAESLRAKRLLEIQREMLGIREQPVSDVTLLDFMQVIIDRKDGTTKTSWQNCREHVMRYDSNPKLRLTDVSTLWVRGFRNYLDRKAKQWDIDSRKREVKPTPLSRGTKALMFQKLCCVFNLAVKEGLIPSNPTLSVERFKEPESDREFLTAEELRVLSATPPPSEVLGRAFFFSCLTGLRWSDIAKLTWGEVQVLKSGTRIVFTQQKTQSLEYLDINSQAVAMMGERRNHRDLVFAGLCTIQQARIMVAAWVRAAGIEKHITFHCARHTFAILMLDAGVDLFTLSKLMGHKSIESTQIYAKILDKNKRAAVEKLPRLF